MQVYALRVEERAKEVYASLGSGVGRFGWSYMHNENGTPLDDADLTRLKSKIDDAGWNSLTKEDQDRYQAFLLDLKEGDWVVYINVPTYGRCTVARVIGPYYWQHIGDDFNHCFPVDPKSVHDFDRNAGFVHPYLRARLVLQGKKWHIYAVDEFKALLKALESHPPPR